MHLAYRELPFCQMKVSGSFIGNVKQSGPSGEYIQHDASSRSGIVLFPRFSRNPPGSSCGSICFSQNIRELAWSCGCHTLESNVTVIGVQLSPLSYTRHFPPTKIQLSSTYAFKELSGNSRSHVCRAEPSEAEVLQSLNHQGACASFRNHVSLSHFFRPVLEVLSGRFVLPVTSDGHHRL